jgi:hypothetical protein
MSSVPRRQGMIVNIVNIVNIVKLTSRYTVYCVCTIFDVFILQTSDPKSATTAVCTAQCLRNIFQQSLN